MKTARARETLGIVLKMELSSAHADEVPYSAHLILNRCVIDDDGNICLTAPAGLLGVLDLVDALKAELDSLANEAVLTFAQSIALRGACLDGIANDNGRGTGGDGRARADTPPLRIAPPPRFTGQSFFPPWDTA